MSDSRLILRKTIYAKRKGLTRKQMDEIFQVEAESHIRNNPDLGFIGIGKPVDNSDLSKTFTMYFAVKPKRPTE